MSRIASSMPANSSPERESVNIAQPQDNAGQQISPETLIWIENRIYKQIWENIQQDFKTAIPIYNTVTFSKETDKLLLSAWTIAAEMRNKEVTENHLLAALLIAGDAERDDEELAMCTGAFVIAASAPLIAGKKQLPQDMRANKNVLQWIAEASNTAHTQTRNVDPSDFALVLREDVLSSGKENPLKNTILKAKRLGSLHIQMEQIHQGVSSVTQTASRHRSYTQNALTKQVGDVDSKLDHLFTQIKNTPNGINPSQLSQLMQQIAVVEKGIAEKITPLLAGAINSNNIQLKNLGGQVALIRDSLPQPPSAGWLTFAIVSVLVLGVFGGFALNNSSSIEPLIVDALNQARSVVAGWKHL